MRDIDTDAAFLLHLQAPCPACDRPVHVVANPVNALSHWVCLRCRTVGTAPFHYQGQLPPQVIVHPAPVASA